MGAFICSLGVEMNMQRVERGHLLLVVNVDGLIATESRDATGLTVYCQRACTLTSRQYYTSHDRT